LDVHPYGGSFSPSPLAAPLHVSVCAVRTEHWRFSKLVEVKRLPVTARVRRVTHRRHGNHPAAAAAGGGRCGVDLTGHRLRLTSVHDAVFLRANAINNGPNVAALI